MYIVLGGTGGGRLWLPPLVLFLLFCFLLLLELLECVDLCLGFVHGIGLPTKFCREIGNGFAVVEVDLHSFSWLVKLYCACM